MASDVGKLLEEALRLPPEARAALASSLMESLDETVDEDAEAEWAKKIQRRIREIESGQVKTVPWAVARREILGG
jgi:putative addiction module component (TIGR02574 family)